MSATVHQYPILSTLVEEMLSFMKVLNPSATHCRNPHIPIMVPRLSIPLPRTLRSSHRETRTATNATAKTMTMNRTSAKKLLVMSQTSHSETPLPGKIRLMSQARVPPMMSHSLRAISYGRL